MAGPQPGRKIAVIGHGGTQNLGDEALFVTVIQNVRRRVPNAEVIGFTINPADSQQRHGIPCFPIRRPDRASTTPAVPSEPAPQKATPNQPQAQPASPSSFKNAIKAIPGLLPLVNGMRRFAHAVVSILAEPKFLFQSYRRLKGAELLLAAGGQQLNDGYGGPWGYPFTLLKWTLLCKLTGTKVALLSVGAGPIEAPLSKFFVRRLLSLVDYRSYRDAISSRLVESIGSKGSHPVFPDLVYSIQLPAPRPAPPAGAKVVVGTNPVPFFSSYYWPTPDEAKYQDYIHKFAKFAEWLAKNGRSVLFFPTQTRADVRTINDIRSAMNGSGNSPDLLQCNPITYLDDLVSEISRADIIIANRYHGILISLMMNKPVLGVAYHEKSRALLTQAGQGDYVLNIEDFKTEDLVKKFTEMEARAPEIKREIAERMAPLRKALEDQYDTVFALVGLPPLSSSKAN
jgi:polysaccharide pyruvyl transferase WcaK-like protein